MESIYGTVLGRKLSEIVRIYLRKQGTMYTFALFSFGSSLLCSAASPSQSCLLFQR